MQIKSIHTLWPEKQGFVLIADRTEDHYVFVHFLSDVTLQNGEVASAGACILYRPYSYRFFCAENEPLVHDWFHVTGKVGEIAAKYGLELNKFYYPGNDSEITEIIRELELETLTERQFSENICALKIEELIAKIARGAETGLLSDSETYERFVSARTYIQTKFYRIKNIEDIASMAGLSVSRFHTLYKKIFGISPKQDLIRIRIEHAKQLLRQRTHSVSETAEIVGYTNQYHFIRQFKQYTGKSPLRYVKDRSDSV